MVLLKAHLIVYVADYSFQNGWVCYKYVELELQFVALRISATGSYSMS